MSCRELAYRVEFAPDAARRFRSLSYAHRRRVRLQLGSLSARAAHGRISEGSRLVLVDELPGSSAGPTLLMRVGYLRLVCDVIDRDRVVLGLTISTRAELRGAVLGIRLLFRHNVRSADVHP